MGADGEEANGKLLAYAERLERLFDDSDAVKESIKDLKAEIKSDGLNVRALVKLVTVRRSKQRLEAEAELISDLLLYAQAAGTDLLQ